MTAYAIAHLLSVDLNGEVSDYLRRIDDTLPAYDGTFLVHGVNPEVVDGELPGNIVIIGFPDVERARAWYHSPGYQAIVALRTRNAVGGAAILEGVPEGYRADSFLAKVHAG